MVFIIHLRTSETSGEGYEVHNSLLKLNTSMLQMQTQNCMELVLVLLEKLSVKLVISISWVCQMSPACVHLIA